MEYICAWCGEAFPVQVWHCPVCDHHWPVEDEECGNCHIARPEADMLAEARRRL